MKFHTTAFVFFAISTTVFSAEPVLVHVNARYTTARMPWSGPIIENRSGNGIVCESTVLASIETLRFAESVTIRDERTGEEKVQAIRHHAFDGGVTVLDYDPDGIESQNSASSDEDIKKREKKKVCTFENVDSPVSSGDRVMIKGRNERGIVRSKSVLISSVEDVALTDGGRDRFPAYIVDSRLDEIWYGSPVYHRDQFAGMIVPCEKNRTCVLSVRHLNHILRDISDGNYDGFANPGFTYSSIRNEYHRKVRKLDGSTGGIQINRITPFRKKEDLIRGGDIILAVNKNPVTVSGLVMADGQAETLENYLSYLDASRGSISILRGKQKIDLDIGFRADPFRSQYRMRTAPIRKYILKGGIIFQQLDLETIGLIERGKGRLARYRFDHFLTDNLFDQVDSDVVITHFLDDPVNMSYRDQQFAVVKSVNSKPIRSLNDLSKALGDIVSGVIRIDLRDKKLPIILDAGAVDRADKKIREKYNISVEPQI